MGGWPQLTPSEQDSIDELAKEHGGHPRFGRDYMDFSGHRFDEELDLSGLHLVFCSSTRSGSGVRLPLPRQRGCLGIPRLATAN